MLNLTVNSMKICPEAAFTCTAMDLPSTSLRWFLNGDEFARYTFARNHLYPRNVEPENATYNMLIGVVNIQILEASVNENNADEANFLSILTINTTAANIAGSFVIQCGSLAVMESFTVSNTLHRSSKHYQHNDVRVGSSCNFYSTVYWKEV